MAMKLLFTLEHPWSLNARPGSAEAPRVLISNEPLNVIYRYEGPLMVESQVW
jgi:hypothetical protein